MICAIALLIVTPWARADSDPPLHAGAALSRARVE